MMTINNEIKKMTSALVCPLLAMNLPHLLFLEN